MSAVIHRHRAVTVYLEARPNRAQYSYTGFGIYKILGAEGVIFGETESEIVLTEQMLTDLASRSE